MNKIFTRVLILFFAFFIVFPVNGFAKKKEPGKIIKKVKKNSNGKNENKNNLEKKHKQVLGKKHKNIKGKVESLDSDGKEITVIDKKKNIYHFDISESQLVNKNGEKIERNKLKNGSKLRINYDVKSKGKLEAIDVQVKDDEKK